MDAPRVSRDGDRSTVEVADLRQRFGERRDVHRTLQFRDDLVVGSTRVPAGSDLDVDVVLESIQGGISATGTVHVSWEGECRRCLGPVTGDLDVEVAEVFADVAVEGETYPIDHEVIDLSEMARDAVLLELSPAPLCREDCPGPDPDRFTVTVESDDEASEPPRDPRWAALDVLREQPPDN